ncbi:N-6 DNA methylase [Aeromonas jandaei]|uniref:N-6 DNA methylase n=1 Tax=Aeromonas jandaei TaxID=650 RepID=UPI003BA3BCFE
MNQLREHNSKLKKIFELLRDNIGSNTIYQTNLDDINVIMRDHISIEELRFSGVFFTGDELSSKLIRSAVKKIDDDSIVLDPTCGAGNLLITASRNFSVCKGLRDTLTAWGEKLYGFDLYASFIEAAKLRLILEAINRGSIVDCSIEEAISLLINIRVSNALHITNSEVKNITHVIMNPPFCLSTTTRSDCFNKGKVNLSAIIYSYYLDILEPETEITSILPDVLRSGSRYQLWRDYVTSKQDGSVNIIGKFDKSTDVDVFIISGIIKNCPEKIDWKTEGNHTNDVLGNDCTISVGRVVAYRDPEIGPEYPYIHPRNVPMWGTVTTFTERRRFKGTVISPPFLVVRRTSSPGDKNRAVATIICGNEPVAVENHLLILQPKIATIEECKRIFTLLRSETTNSFLNQRIRCRHLTVGAVKQIPCTRRSDEESTC